MLYFTFLNPFIGLFSGIITGLRKFSPVIHSKVNANVIGMDSIIAISITFANTTITV